MSDAPAPTCWPILSFADVAVGRRFLAAMGFEERLIVPHDEDPDVVIHAEAVWPEGGGVMFGTANRPDSEFSQGPTGAVSVYVVTDRPDEVFTRVHASGATVIRELTDQDYGSREFSIRDPEGNLWSFGTYRGAPPV